MRRAIALRLTSSPRTARASRPRRHQLLWFSLLLVPLTMILYLTVHPGQVVMFVLSAASLVPLAWLIGASTEQAAEHAGHEVAALLNASFGNAPELIVALLALHSALTEVVLGSLAGSVVSNLLLVLGVTLVVGPERLVDRRSLLGQLGLVALGVAVFVGSALAVHWGAVAGSSKTGATVALGTALVVAYCIATRKDLEHSHSRDRERASEYVWSLRLALALLALATLATAVVSEILVESLSAFASAMGASEMFVAAVIVAVVGNAAEHGGSVVIAKAGKMKLATEIATSSAAQVTLLVAPAVVLLSRLSPHPIGFAFTSTELLALTVAVALAVVSVWEGRTSHKRGAMLVAAYVAAVAGFFVAGNG